LKLLSKALPFFILLQILFLQVSSPGGKSFKEEQQQFIRVRTARAEKEESIRQLFRQKAVGYPPDGIILIAYKLDRILELWACGDGDKYTLIRSYPICRLSGELGPKRCEGDMQIPEGFYKIVLFNPVSNYHLSMMINYPNKSDKILGCKRPGGLIFIHGNCVTIGCIPITDDMIKELYLICVDVKSGKGVEIPVYIFPTRLTDTKMKELETLHRDERNLIAFWRNIKTGYDLFEETGKPLSVKVDKAGSYIIKR
jgi:murein L,D-transpeptidase YafK